MNNTSYKKSRRYSIIVYTVIILYCIVLFFQVYKGTFETMRDSYSVEFVYGKTPFSSFAMHLATLLFIMTGVVSYKPARLSVFSSLALLVLVVYMGVYFLFDIAEYGLMTIIHQTMGPMVYFILLGLFISFEDGIWEKVVDVCRLLGPVLLVLSLIVTFSFLSNYGSHIGNSPQILLLGNGFWATSIAIIGTGEKDKTARQIVNIICLGCGLATSILYGTRSWSVQCLLLSFLYYYKQSTSKRINILYVIVFVLLISFGYSYIENTFSDNVDYLAGRLYDNTRSFQYQEIFSQYSFVDLFLGKGTFGTYHSSLYGDYAYIDNVFMYIWLHWGFIPALCIAFVLLYPVVKQLFSKNSPFDRKLRAMIIILWVLSISGLAVYNTILFDLRNVLIALTLGKCYKDITSAQINRRI